MSILGDVVGIFTGNSVRKKQKNQIKDQQRIAAIKNKQAKRQFLNDFRRAQATSVVGGIAATGGGFESSRISATDSSLVTQKALSLDEFETLGDLGDNIAESQMDIGRLNFANSVFQTIDSGIENVGGVSGIPKALKSAAKNLI